MPLFLFQQKMIVFIPRSKKMQDEKEKKMQLFHIPKFADSRIFSVERFSFFLILGIRIF